MILQESIAETYSDLLQQSIHARVIIGLLTGLSYRYMKILRVVKCSRFCKKEKETAQVIRTGMGSLIRSVSTLGFVESFRISPSSVRNLLECVHRLPDQDPASSRTFLNDKKNESTC